MGSGSGRAASQELIVRRYPYGEDMLELLVAIIALIVGVALGVLLARARAQGDSAEGNTRLAHAIAEAATAKSEAAQAREATARLQALQANQSTDAAQARERVATAELRAAEAEKLAAQASAHLAGAVAERDAAVARATELAQDRQTMVDQFKLVSNQTLAEHGKAADQAADQRLKATEQLLGPVKEALGLMHERINQVEKSREGMSAELREQVRTIVATNESLRRETHSLTTALRTPQIRGAWGEQSLRRIVEASGMVDHCDFTEQTSTNTDDGRLRPDMTIKLADGKVVFVDSKVPLTSLLDANETEDAAKQADHLKRFGKRVRAHVDDLAKKQYWALEAGSPEFVVMFLASEEIFRAALTQQPDLLDYAGRKQVVIASPSTLIALLKSVAHAWKQAVLAESAAEVSKLGRELYERLALLGDHFDGVGRGLQSATRAYNKAIGSLEGRVLVTARRLNDLEVTNAELPGPKAVSEAVRGITAPELLAEPEGTVWERKAGRGGQSAADESALLRRPMPTSDELLDFEELPQGRDQGRATG